MIKVNGKTYEYGHFPDGTLKMELDTKYEDIFKIIWLYNNQEEQIVLYNLVKHIRKYDEKIAIELYLYYIPNARMDRVKQDYEVFTLKYFCEFINDLNFNSVNVLDPHSDISIALLNNCRTDVAESYLNIAINKCNPDVLFFPDMGAEKKYSDMFALPYCYGVKKRDWKTGEILGLRIVTNGIDLKDKKVLIIDDICSKGGTFYYSAKKLLEYDVKNIALYVSHCENSIFDGEFGKDKNNLLNSDLIDKIYTTDTILARQHEKIEIIGGFRL